MSVPDDVREALKVAMSDKQTPYVSRRNKSYDDGRIYEVIRLDNPDWRDVITDDQTVMGRFPNDKEANALCADLEAEFRLDAILSAIKEAGWVCVPVRATYEIETAVRPCDFPRPDIYGDIDANDAEAFLASAWTAMLTAAQEQKP